MSEIHLTGVRNGFAWVTCGNRIIGTVERINWPTQTDGIVKNEQRWEARKDHEHFIVNPYGFPAFQTRAEAVDYLAEKCQLG